MPSQIMRPLSEPSRILWMARPHVKLLVSRMNVMISTVPASNNSAGSGAPAVLPNSTAYVANSVENSEISAARKIQKPTIFICPWCVLYSRATSSVFCSLIGHPPHFLFSFYNLIHFNMISFVVIEGADDHHDNDTHETNHCKCNPFEHQCETCKEHDGRHDERLSCVARHMDRLKFVSVESGLTFFLHVD